MTNELTTQSDDEGIEIDLDTPEGVEQLYSYVTIRGLLFHRPDLAAALVPEGATVPVPRSDGPAFDGELELYSAVELSGLRKHRPDICQALAKRQTDEELRATAEHDAKIEQAFHQVFENNPTSNGDILLLSYYPPEDSQGAPGWSDWLADLIAEVYEEEGDGCSSKTSEDGTIIVLFSYDEDTGDPVIDIKPRKFRISVTEITE